MLKLTHSTPEPAPHPHFLLSAQLAYQLQLMPTRPRAEYISYGQLWPGSDHLFEWSVNFHRPTGLARVRHWHECEQSPDGGYWQPVFAGYLATEAEFVRLLEQLGWPLNRARA